MMIIIKLFFSLSRSLRPLYPLLRVSQPSAVQLWALWGIKHICTHKGERHMDRKTDEKRLVFVQLEDYKLCPLGGRSGMKTELSQPLEYFLSLPLILDIKVNMVRCNVKCGPI